MNLQDDPKLHKKLENDKKSEISGRKRKNKVVVKLVGEIPSFENTVRKRLKEMDKEERNEYQRSKYKEKMSKVQGKDRIRLKEKWAAEKKAGRT